jgi:hypothetical protein
VANPVKYPTRRTNGKIRYTFHLHEVVIEKARDVVFHLGGEETMASLCEAALIEFIDTLETERGKPFPKRTGDVAVGRPKSLDN